MEEKINLDLSDDIEIIDVITTCEKNRLQIVAKDNKKNILIVFIWDFEKNKEITMY